MRISNTGSNRKFLEQSYLLFVPVGIFQIRLGFNPNPHPDPGLAHTVSDEFSIFLSLLQISIVSISVVDPDFVDP